MILSILIPTMPERKELFYGLVNELESQIKDEDVEILANDRMDISIGEKRNILLQQAKGTYVAFFDDDDKPSEDYIETLLKAIRPDCVSLRGLMTWNGKRPEIFEHSIKHKVYKTVPGEIRYIRYPNHLNCIRADIAKQFTFPPKNHGEDTDWANKLFNSGLLKRECYVNKILYYYNFLTRK